MELLKQRTVMDSRRSAAERLRAFSGMEYLSGMLLAVMLAGCSSGPVNIPVSTAAGPQLYMAPVIAGGDATQATASLATYSIDDTAETFAQATYFSSGETVNYAGSIAPLQRGLLGLGVNYSDNAYTSVTNGWAFELAGQAGGLVALQNQAFAPLVSAVSCPAMTNPETFWFVTLPAVLTTGAGRLNWNPQTETAYGSADISASGSTVTLSNIKQFTLPVTVGGAPGTPANPAPSSVTGGCSPSVYGNTVSIPASASITRPGNGQQVTPQAALGIGPSGLLVEDNGTGSTAGNANASINYYQNALGAGTGAIGLPKPSAAVDTGSLAGAQYLGFFYGTGTGSGAFNTNWSTTLASFGFPPALQSSCSTFAAQTGSLVNGIYGGDFTGNNPAVPAVQTTNQGFGNCDFAVDLGVQDPSNNGLYPAATVYVGSAFAENTTGTTYHFPAVAIAGQLNGKYAIFLIGQDTAGSPKQAWGIYLLQSN